VEAAVKHITTATTSFFNDLSDPVAAVASRARNDKKLSMTRDPRGAYPFRRASRDQWGAVAEQQDRPSGEHR